MNALPCPFCGGINIVREGFHLCCWSCGADGPDADEGDEESLIAAWNRREPVAQPVKARSASGSPSSESPAAR